VLSIVVILVEYFYPLTETQSIALYALDATVVAVLAADFANRVEIGSETHACIPCFTVKPHILDD